MNTPNEGRSDRGDSGRNRGNRGNRGYRGNRNSSSRIRTSSTDIIDNANRFSGSAWDSDIRGGHRSSRPDRGGKSGSGRVRRAVVHIPNGFTLANLFFGVFAIVTASRGDFSTAGFYVVLGGIADALDGRVARATGSNSRFGSELDSLVDAISFGLAPAMIMYFAVLNQDGWEWIFTFLFVACAVIRLARFNIEQAGREKKYFHGLPSPAAGITLATYYWFSQTSLYTETMIADLPWHVMLRYIMVILSFLMISNVSYPVIPKVGYKSLKEIMGALLIIGVLVGIVYVPKEFFFPAALLYVLYGLAKTVIAGLLGWRPRGDSPVIDDEDPIIIDDEEEDLPPRIVATTPSVIAGETSAIVTNQRTGGSGSGGGLEGRPPRRSSGGRNRGRRPQHRRDGGEGREGRENRPNRNPGGDEGNTPNTASGESAGGRVNSSPTESPYSNPANTSSNEGGSGNQGSSGNQGNGSNTGGEGQ